MVSHLQNFCRSRFTEQYEVFKTIFMVTPRDGLHHPEILLLIYTALRKRWTLTYEQIKIPLKLLRSVFSTHQFCNR